jgi:hypothetical protein
MLLPYNRLVHYVPGCSNQIAYKVLLKNFNIKYKIQSFHDHLVRERESERVGGGEEDERDREYFWMISNIN